MSKVINTVRSEMRSAARASARRDAEAAEAASKHHDENMAATAQRASEANAAISAVQVVVREEALATREVVAAEGQATPGEIVDVGHELSEQADEVLATLLKISQASIEHRKQDREARRAERDALSKITQDTLSTRQMTAAASVRSVEAADKSIKAPETSPMAAEKMSEAGEVAVSAAEALTDAAAAFERVLVEIKSGDWVSKAINPRVATVQMMNEQQLEEEVNDFLGRSHNQTLVRAPGKAPPSSRAPTSAKGRPTARGSPAPAATRATRSMQAKRKPAPAPVSAARIGKTKTGKAPAGVAGVVATTLLQPDHESWFERKAAAGEPFRQVIAAAAANGKMEETLNVLGEGLTKALMAAEFQVAFALMESLEFIFDHLGAAAAPLLLCGTSAADGTILDALLKVTANPKMRCVREAAHALALRLVSIAPSAAVLSVVLRVGATTNAAKAMACAAALVGVLVEAVPVPNGKLDDVEACLGRFLVCKHDDVQDAANTALMSFAAAGYSSQVKAIVDSIDNRPVREKLIKLLDSTTS